MTTQEISAGAPSHESGAWHNIDWAKCHREVRRLQVRIVKATREGKYSKVKALQWLLTHSFSGKAIAVKRVTGNQGKRTPGVDRVLWSTPKSRFQAIETLKRRGYRALPLRRINIPKTNGKLRPLGIPTMKDRAMQALYLLALEPVSETTADRCSFGFRPERSTADAIERCFKLLSRKCAPAWILEGDIKGCFDNISHEWLLDNVQLDNQIMKRWLKAGYIENQHSFPTISGTPQGGIISPILANIALDGLEKALCSIAKQRWYEGKSSRPKINLVRYADDFIITGSSKEQLENEVIPVVKEFMAARGLTLSPEKTRITHINDGFNFLGQNIRKYNGKLLVKPSAANVRFFLRKVRETIRGNWMIRQVKLIGLLNPMITGWANFHRHVVSSKAFSRVDFEIWRSLWQWASRRHKNKSKVWIKQRYFHVTENRNWVFAALSDRYHPDGTQILLTLRYASDTKIKRHRQIQTEANPFGPRWEMYFEERMSLKMQNSLKGRNKLINMWLRQGKRCPHCRQLITSESGWHIHHIVRRVDGGEDVQSNLLMLHPECHAQLHSSDFPIVKPASVMGL
ncbi:group II intron reverse transcriptase/maturase [Salmonella enterica subsp. salamae]|nr:group II intron reverse transcriptase/maturase [Salmonella enterica subsp. salamae]